MVWCCISCLLCILFSMRIWSCLFIVIVLFGCLIFILVWVVVRCFICWIFCVIMIWNICILLVILLMVGSWRKVGIGCRCIMMLCRRFCVRCVRVCRLFIFLVIMMKVCGSFVILCLVIFRCVVRYFIWCL